MESTPNWGTLLICTSDAFCFFQQQLKNALLIHSQLKGWQVTADVKNGVRGYREINLHRPPRRPGYEFGGRDTQERVRNYMAAIPIPLPPTEVSFLTNRSEIFFRVFFSSDSY